MPYQFDPEFVKALGFLKDNPIDDAVASRVRYEQTIQALTPDLDTSGLTIIDKKIPGYQSDSEVPIRVYIPDNIEKPGPALLDIHGGGFVIGSIETEHAVAVRFAKSLGVIVVSVDYRLAPEHPFPAGLHDCYAALKWMHSQAKELSIDRNKIGVYGVSAGGGLAAGLTFLARDMGGPDICFQCLNIPELDDRLETESAKQFVDTPVWNRPKALTSWRYYLGEEYSRGSDDVPEQAAPARAKDLRDLPPAFVSAMEFDPLRDEDVAYALRLMQSGVQTELHSYPGTFHGSSMFPAEVTKRQSADMLGALRRGLKIKSDK
ncbi:MAG: alpha/beta hydrolase [Cellvibrionaceae bacterium]